MTMNSCSAVFRLRPRWGTWLATIACLAIFSPVPLTAQERVLSESLLPENTRAWVSVPDAAALREALEQSQFGKMTEDPEVKPFVDDLVRQFRAYLNEQNVQFGMTLSDLENVRSGEICLAGILRPSVAGAADAATDHALVLMVDVIDTEENARELLEKVAVEFNERGATSESLVVHSIEATKWSFRIPRGLREQQHTYQAIAGRWLLACDNERVFRQLVGQIAGVEGAAARRLAENDAFQQVAQQTLFDDEGYAAHVRWFIEPFGYMYLAQAIADARDGKKGPRNDYAKILQDEGFAAIKGIGGALSVNTGKHEAVHRTFIYAPHSEEAPFVRGAAMLDFTNDDDDALTPAAWVPENAASLLTLSWNLSNALEKVGHLIDSLTAAEGSWDRSLRQLENDVNGPRVDLRKVVSLLENRITIVAVAELPIDENSERMMFGIKIREDESYVADSVYRLVKNNADVTTHEGTRILVVNTEDQYDKRLGNIDDDFLSDEFDDEFGDPGIGGEATTEEEEEFKRPRPLFEKQVLAVKNGYLLMGNNVEQMISVIDQMDEEPGKALAEAEDYQRVRNALDELAGDAPPNFRHFGRMDLELRTNYEMMRTGRMAQSKTLLAQLLNRSMKDEDAAEDAVREQKFDGSKMPEDFEGKVARYLGPTGLVLHNLEEGWLITGCVLEKSGSDVTSVESEPSSPSVDPPSSADPPESDDGKDDAGSDE